MHPTNIAVIRGYHAHAYFDASTRGTAMAVLQGLLGSYALRSSVRETAVGLHPKPFWMVDIARHQLDHVVPWLMLNRRGLSVLVHPMTGDAAADHGAHALWLGPPLALAFDRLQARGAPAARAPESQPAL